MYNGPLNQIPIEDDPWHRTRAMGAIYLTGIGISLVIAAAAKAMESSGAQRYLALMDECVTTTDKFLADHETFLVLASVSALALAILGMACCPHRRPV